MELFITANFSNADEVRALIDDLGLILDTAPLQN